MTQGIPYATSSYGTASGTRATAASTTQPVTTGRSAGWLVQALRGLARFIASRRRDDVPEALREDVGLGTRRTAAERRSEFTRLDAQLHARFY
ncbi:MAG: hypothetical protein ACOH1Y_01225 [Propionicimonas sp.]